MSEAAKEAAWWPFGAPREGASVRLFCLPYAGGGATVFRGWRLSAPREIDVVPIQLPGREARIRHAPFRRLGPLVEALDAILRPTLAPAYALFGHSMGALIAFELARRLVRLGAPPPVRLFVSAARAPHLPRGSQVLHALPDAEFVAALREFDGTPEAVLAEPELMELILPSLRADFEVCETYRYEDAGRVGFPVTAFGGREDKEVSADDLGAWGDLTSAPFDLRELAGGHFFLGPRSVELLAEIVDTLRGPARVSGAGPEPRSGDDPSGASDAGPPALSR